MAQLRRPDGLWELLDVDREGGWEAVADMVRQRGCDAVIVVAEARARLASPPQPGPGDEVLLFALADLTPARVASTSSCRPATQATSQSATSPERPPPSRGC
jgi:hypothetical protein